MISFKELGNLGRIGNQLFQAGTTIALALRNNDQYIFPNWDYAQYCNVTNCFSNNIQITKTYSEPYFQYCQIPYQQNLNLNGFFQSEKYFSDYKEVIRELLTPKNNIDIQYNNTAIHVRRGDYVNLIKEYVQLDMSYYKKAMSMIRTEYYTIFSDDIEWCKANFTDNNIIFSENKTPVEDLALMSKCGNNIIANSSFSWWGAYLNTLPSKMVIAPAKWFGPALNHNTKDLLPDNWIKI
jgi:hypothetical protein